MGTFAVARKGRKRKTGPRHPGGQIVDEPRESPRVIALHQPHRQAVREAARLDQRAESPFGTLILNRVITSAQYRAGCRYARMFRRYLATISAPSPNLPSIAGILQPGGGGGFIPDAIARERKLEYDAAFEYLGTAGQRAQRAVARIAVNDQHCPEDEIENLRNGLSTLDQYFILTDRAKSDYYRNTT